MAYVIVVYDSAARPSGRKISRRTVPTPLKTAAEPVRACPSTEVIAGPVIARTVPIAVPR
jgi:hypothetical protein